MKTTLLTAMCAVAVIAMGALTGVCAEPLGVGLGPVVRHSEVDEPVIAEMPAMKQLVVVNEKFETTDLDLLPDNVRDVADAVLAVTPKATFKPDGTTLRVGITVPDKEKGSVLFKAAWRSDCPVNSQYGVENGESLVFSDEDAKLILTEWTRARHGRPNGPLDMIVFTPYQSNGSWSNYDVRLMHPVGTETAQRRRLSGHETKVAGAR